MAKAHRRVDAQIAQGSLLDDPDFLHEIVERGCSRSYWKPR